MLPHLLVVGARNFGDPDPAWSGWKLSGEHGGGGGGQIGEEIGPPPLPPVSFLHQSGLTAWEFGNGNPVWQPGNSEKGVAGVVARLGR